MLKRISEGILSGALFALIMWSLFSALNSAPTYTHHHLLAFLFWLGLVYAIGWFTCEREHS